MDTISFDRTMYPESSIVEQVDYNTLERKLLVTLHDSRYKYLYHDVPPEIFGGLCAVDSVGWAFNNILKGKYEVQRVEHRLVDVDAEL